LYRPEHHDLVESIAGVGHGIEDVSIIINSHLHFDHCDNNRLFPGVPTVVQRREYDLSAAESVLASVDLDVSDVVDLLGQLVDKSLVVADNNDHDDGGVRYRLLESIRQYAAERLEATGDTAAVRRRHADH
jgi:predicted ATPase